MPAPPEAIDTVVQSTVEDHAKRQSRVAYAAALLFFANAGLSDDDLNRWLRAYLPWQRQAILDAARRGYSYSSLLWSLQTDSLPDALSFDAEESPLVNDVLARSEQYATRPVIRARWEASKIKEAGDQPGPPARSTTIERPTVPPIEAPEVDAPAPTPGVDTVDRPDPRVRPEVAQAKRAAEAARLVPEATDETSTLSDSMERGAARAAEQAMAETNDAFGAGMDQYAEQPTKKVARWLKAPHARACSFCFLVSTRGYRTAQAAMAAGHRACKCGAKVIYVEPRRNRKRNQAEVSNWFWADELDRQGYGLLFGAGELDADGRLAVVQELFPEVDVPPRA